MPKQSISSHNLDSNLAATFSYLVPVVTGIMFLVIDKKDHFVRFHAMQSIVFWLLVLVVWPFLWVLRVVVLCYWFFLMWKAYSKEKYKIPYLGNFALTLLKTKAK